MSLRWLSRTDTFFSLLRLGRRVFRVFSSPSHSKTSSSPTMTRSSRTKQRRIDVKWKINFDSYFDNTRMHAFTRLIRTRRFLRVKKDPIIQQRVEKILKFQALHTKSSTISSELAFEVCSIRVGADEDMKKKKTQTKIISRMDWMINDATEFALIMKRY